MIPTRALVTPALLGVLSLTSTAAAQEVFPRIINGTPTSDFPSVGIVSNQQFGCSGTLISPSHVLTAAHCAAMFSGPTDGSFELDSGVYTTSAIFIHPDYDPDTLENDIAILELSKPALETPSPVFGGTKPDGDPLSGGEELTIVGFGGGGDAQGSDGTFGVKRSGVVTIDEVTATQILWTFDDPTEADTAPGDSGGPGFYEVDGEMSVASVTSGGSLADAGLGDMAFNTRVDAFLEWIDMVLQSMPDDGTDGGEEDNSSGGMCPGWNAFRGELHKLFAPLRPIFTAITHWFENVHALQQGRGGGLRSVGRRFGFGQKRRGSPFR